MIVRANVDHAACHYRRSLDHPVRLASVRELMALVVALTGLQPEMCQSNVLYADVRQSLEVFAARVDKAFGPLMPGHET